LDPTQDGEQVRLRAAYLPGETSVYHQMTGQQFLDFAKSFYPRQRTDMVRDLLDLFALPLHQRVRSYSAGMKQKLALVATLAPEQELYLLDEPDRALDASVRLQLRDVLQRLHKSGCTIVLCSHHLAEIETLADRLEFLLEGRLVPLPIVERARERLQRRMHLRLAPGTPPPVGCTVLETRKDGTMVLETEGDPIALLQRLPQGSLRSVELGVAHLEELYQTLLAEVAS
jgi:ABC-2 type transport system ATP-binding protein